MEISIANYLIQKLKGLGCKHVFGIPGTSCADFFFAIDADDGIDYILTANELEAGYMADGYGRFARLGAVCVSYGVGTLSLVNAVASAYTEKVPMAIINGGPTLKDKWNLDKYGILFSHSTGRRDTDLAVFQHITVGTLLWDDTVSSIDIDRLFTRAIEKSGPIYIEIPSDKWKTLIKINQIVEEERNADEVIDAFVEHAKKRISTAKKPALLIGSEIARRNASVEVLKWLEETGLPFATTLLSKSVIDENHPNFVGTYDSDLAPKAVREVLEESDCLITMGCVFGIDLTLLIKKQFDQMIDVSYGVGRIGKDTFANIDLLAFLAADFTNVPQGRSMPSVNNTFEARRQMIGAVKKEICTHDSIFAAVNAFINSSKENYLVTCDTCLGAYPAADLNMPATDMFLGNPVWLSIGQGTPAAVGAFFASQKRPLIITGDGGFQMVAQAFATMVRYMIPAIIIVIDNSLYAIEQFLLDGEYFLKEEKPPIQFNVLKRWNYEQFPAVFGGTGCRVRAIDELKKALDDAQNVKNLPCLIAAEVASKDLPAENLEYLMNNSTENFRNKPMI